MNFPRLLSGRRSRLASPAVDGETALDGITALDGETVLDGEAPYPGHPPQAGETAGDTERAQYLGWVAATVGEHGWAITGRHGDEGAPPWAYSIGLWLSCQGPELVLCGLPVERAAAIINAIGSRIADGADFGPDDVLDDICPAPLRLRPVDPSWRATSGLLPVSDAFYGMVRPPYLQVVWSDKDGRFPGEAGFQPAYDQMQPLLWLPRDDNPPAAWTRLDELG